MTEVIGNAFKYGFKVGDEVMWINSPYDDVIYKVREDGRASIKDEYFIAFTNCPSEYQLVSRKEEMKYEIGKWYPHCGKEQPVDDDTIIRFKRGDGTESEEDWYSKYAVWDLDKSLSYSIIAFSVVSYPKKVEGHGYKVGVWHPWDGKTDTPPVEGKVEIMLSSEVFIDNRIGKGWSWKWKNNSPSNYDIVAFKPLEE